MSTDIELGNITDIKSDQCRRKSLIYKEGY